MLITSLENENVKKWKKLCKKKYRDEYGIYLVEGEHLVEEAYKSGVLDKVLVLDGENYSYDNVIYVSYEVMKAISSLDTPNKIMGVCKKKENNEIIGKRFLLLDGIQDPGNLGTIVRSAVAFNIDTIILSNETVDLYNPKVLRSTQGMIFHTNIFSYDMVAFINILKSMGITVYGTDVNNGIDVRDLSSSDKKSFALVMGNEGNGVREEINEQCTKKLYIDMNKNVESLNVGIAASILLYELGR
jgi:TrmH family RNA methyltransferase